MKLTLYKSHINNKLISLLSNNFLCSVFKSKIIHLLKLFCQLIRCDLINQIQITQLTLQIPQFMVNKLNVNKYVNYLILFGQAFFWTVLLVLQLGSWEVNPYEKVATLTLTFLSTFASRLKSRSGCQHFSFKFPAISNIFKISLYIKFTQ